ncbi:MAG: hypothetical protein ACRENA_13840 [Vulcanimicrobiaceae bacterium]
MSDKSSNDDANIISLAKEWVRRSQLADIDYSQLRDGFPMTAESARRMSKIVAPLGEPSDFKVVNRKTNKLGITQYHFHVSFACGTIWFVLGAGADGKINQLSFKPIPGETGHFQSLMDNTPPRGALPKRLPGESDQSYNDRLWTEIFEKYEDTLRQQ